MMPPDWHRSGEPSPSTRRVTPVRW